MKVTEFQPETWIRNFGVRHGKPGWLYALKFETRLKIGKTINLEKRLQEARTRIPDIEIVGAKPFWKVAEKERDLHIILTD